MALQPAPRLRDHCSVLAIIFGHVWTSQIVEVVGDAIYRHRVIVIGSRVEVRLNRRNVRLRHVLIDSRYVEIRPRKRIAPTQSAAHRDRRALAAVRRYFCPR